MLKAKRLDVVEQLDRVVVAISVYAYLADPSFLLLLLRIVVQTQLSRPQEFAHRPLPFFFRFITIFFLGSLLRNHLYGPGSGSGGPSGVFLDFIGKGAPTTAMAVLAQTVLIYALQAVCLVVAYETGHSPPPRDLPHPFFLVAPPAPSSPSASASGQALENLEVQPPSRTDDTSEGKEDWVPYADFLSPVPEPPRTSRARARNARAKGKERERSSSPSQSTSLLLPSEQLPADESPDSDAPYLPADATSASIASDTDPDDVPVLALRPWPLLSRLTGIGRHARPPPDARTEGDGLQGEWETFWNGASAGGMRDGLALGFGASPAAARAGGG